MGVEGTASSEEIISAVEAAGYGAALIGSENSLKSTAEAASELENKDYPLLKKRLLWSIKFEKCCILVLLLFLLSSLQSL